MSERTILVTSALPYANGPIHLGHLVEYIQTDIWVRFQKQRGHRCFFVCADDSHGTPIMLRADSEGISPEDLIARVSIEHQADFKEFSVDFDHYHSTHSEENKTLSALIYQRLKEQDYISSREITQAYDPEKEMFLPDRFIKGDCPKCDAKDQYGDNCEVCGTTYSPTDLKNAVSVVSGAKPIENRVLLKCYESGFMAVMFRIQLKINWMSGLNRDCKNGIFLVMRLILALRSQERQGNIFMYG